MRTILLVDDDKNILDSLARILTHDDYNIVKCTNALDAWKFVNDENGVLDLVISDNKMPDTGGMDFLVAMRTRYPDVIRIMLTGDANLEDAKRAINEGEVYRFLSKPVDPLSIELIVRHALAHKDLWHANQILAKKVKQQEQIIQALEKEQPGITHVEKDEDGNVIINATYFCDSFDDFMKRYF